MIWVMAKKLTGNAAKLMLRHIKTVSTLFMYHIIIYIYMELLNRIPNWYKLEPLLAVTQLDGKDVFSNKT